MGAANFFFAVRKILAIQGLVIGVASAVGLAVYGWGVARSVFLGGLVGFLPNVCFACTLAGSKARTAQQVVRSFYVGEALKLALTAVLLYWVIQMPDVLFIPLFAGFLAVIMVFWFALLLS